MSATKASSSPRPTWAASAIAASLALWTMAAAIRSRTVIRSPARRRTPEPVTPTASRSTVTTSSSFVRSSATSTVISLVMLAGGTRCCALRVSRTSPVAAFTTS